MTSTPSRESTALRIAVAFLFIASGAAGLIYEVVWTRSLTNFFGASLYAVATVLASFMGGLALGSWLAGKRADSLRRPLFAYGVVELAIAAAALAFAPLLKATEPLVGAVYVTGGERTFYLFSLLRFAITAGLLLIPTTLMGATLPLLSKALAREQETLGRDVGRLYALNTAGACLGVFAAGFLLVEKFGITGAKHVAAVLNVAVGLLAMAIGRSRFLTAGDASANADPGPPLPHRRLVLWTYALSGFAALGLQVCWFRALIFSFDKLKNTTYSFSGMLLVFLVGLTAGSTVMQWAVRSGRPLLRLYGLVQLGVGVAAAFSFFVIVRMEFGIPDITGDELIWPAAVANVLLRTAAAIGLPTFLMGAAFPVAVALVARGRDELGRDVAALYAANTLGAIAGSFATGFVLVPLFGLAGSIVVLSAIGIAIGVFVLSRDPDSEPAQRRLRLGLAVGASVVVLARLWSGAMGTPFQRIQPDETIVYYAEGPAATVSVLEGKTGERMIYVDDVGVAGTDKIIQTDQKTLAHVPMMLLGGEGTRVLTVGFGSGGASWSYTRYPGLREIHAIEISKEVLGAASVLTKSNHGIIYSEDVLARARAAGAGRMEGAAQPIDAYTHTPVPGFRTFDPRYRVLIEDARAYLRFTKLKYDVIATDCTDLRYKSNANLYDLEYFRLCREALTERGLVVVWMPLAGLNEAAFKCALRTFDEVFPQMTVWFFPNQPTHYCLLIGGRGPVRIDWQELEKATRILGIREDLVDIGLDDPQKIASCFVADERTMPAHLGEGPLNTEDRPFIEFESPRHGYGPGPLAVNMSAIYAVQVPATTLLVGAPEEAVGRIARLQEANAILFQGHIHYRAYEFTEACERYMAAKAIVPDDASIDRLLDFEEFLALLDRNAETPDANVFAVAQSLGAVYLMQKRYEDVVTRIEPFADRLPAPRAVPSESVRKSAIAILHVLADAYAAAGRPQRAADLRERATRYTK